MKLNAYLFRVSVLAGVSLVTCTSPFGAVYKVENKVQELGSHFSHFRDVIKDSLQMSHPEGSKPKFCHGLNCPVFKTLNSTKNYELREYEESRWVSTQLMNIAYDAAAKTMFMKLFYYIQGANEKKMKIDMTAPVLDRVIPGQGPACENNFTMSFYLAPKVKDPPNPTNKDVYFSKLPKQKVFVSFFGGEASEDDWIKHGRELATALTKDNRKFDDSYFYTAGYDSPFRLLDRHNEIWYIAKE